MSNSSPFELAYGRDGIDPLPFVANSNGPSINFKTNDRAVAERACVAARDLAHSSIRTAARAALESHPAIAKLRRLCPQLATANSERASVASQIAALEQQRAGIVQAAPTDLRESLKTIDAKLAPLRAAQAELDTELATINPLIETTRKEADAAAVGQCREIQQRVTGEYIVVRAQALQRFAAAAAVELLTLYESCAKLDATADGKAAGRFCKLAVDDLVKG